MARPVMARRKRVRVEFSLSEELADLVYQYAHERELTLSQTGERLLWRVLGARDSNEEARVHLPHVGLASDK